jgi:B12-binding domain/radical SAM domain protein
MSRYDAVLVHAPSVYDFRKRSLLFGPVSDLIPSTPVFEMYPIGFATIASILDKNGFRVRFLNLAAHMLADEKFDVERAIGRIDADIFGIDLHWLPHAHGSIEIARMIKSSHPNSKVVFGGMSSTYYYEELLRDNPFIDAVFLGDSTELPMLQYASAVEKDADIGGVQNLAYRGEGRIKSNRITHIVSSLDEVDFDYGLIVRMVAGSLDLTGHLPYLGWKKNPMLLVSTMRGCSHNCVTCMGSCSSFNRNFGRTRPAYRSPEKVIEDLNQIESYFRGAVFILGDLQQPGSGYAERLLAQIKEERPRNEMVVEFYTPPSTALVDSIGKSMEQFDAQISPDSHDPEVRAAQGRRYSNESLERSIEDLLKSGARRVDVFFMTGLPRQDSLSVQGTVDYSRSLMFRTRAGGRLLPFISPLAPFIDPGSDAFEDPQKHGYRIFARTLAEHRGLLLQPSWKYVLNYETEWMSRSEIVDSTYSAGLGMNAAKQEAGAISKEDSERVAARIQLAKEAMVKIDAALKSANPESELSALKEEMKNLSESTVCDKTELDWSRKSFYRSIPRATISMLLGR